MEWVASLRGKTVALDTAPLIYFIERNRQYRNILRPFFAAVAKGDTRIVTSTLTLMEVLVHPLRHGNELLAHRYSDILLSSPNVTTVPITSAIAKTAAQLRATTSLKTPDAIQLATAITEKVDVLLTGDRDFRSSSTLPVFRVSDLAESILRT